jgi:hypothetical protein
VADLFGGMSTQWAHMLLEGEVILFLGAGANMTGRPRRAKWRDGYLPNTRELAAHLAERFGDPGAKGDLARLSQYVEATRTRARLEERLRTAFDRTPLPEPTALHHFLAEIRGLAQDHGRPPPPQILVTTNYDDALERAFEHAGEPFDLLWYTTVVGQQGRQREGYFMHVPPNGTPARFLNQNEDTGVKPEQRPVILKVHGAVHRDRRAPDSFVISEDDYIDYLGFVDIDALPVLVKRDWADRSYLFLGYGLGDWNMNVLLRRVWSQRGPEAKLWAVQHRVAELDRLLWDGRGVMLYKARLERWVHDVRAEMLAILERSAA